MDKHILSFIVAFLYQHGYIVGHFSLAISDARCVSHRWWPISFLCYDQDHDLPAATSLCTAFLQVRPPYYLLWLATLGGNLLLGSGPLTEATEARVAGVEAPLFFDRDVALVGKACLPYLPYIHQGALPSSLLEGLLNHLDGPSVPLEAVVSWGVQQGIWTETTALKAEPPIQCLHSSLQALQGEACSPEEALGRWIPSLEEGWNHRLSDSTTFFSTTLLIPHLLKLWEQAKHLPKHREVLLPLLGELSEQSCVCHTIPSLLAPILEELVDQVARWDIVGERLWYWKEVQMNNHFYLGKYDEVKQAYEAFLADSTCPKEYCIAAFIGLGKVSVALGDLDEAGVYYRQAEGLGGISHSKVNVLLDGKAICLVHEKKYEEAERTLLQYVAMIEAQEGPTSSYILMPYSHLMDLARMQGALEKAREYGEKMQDLIEQYGFQNYSINASLQVNMGNLCMEEQDIDGAYGCYESARVLWEEVVAPNSVMLLDLYGKMASAQEELGMYMEARETLRKGFQLAERGVLAPYPKHRIAIQCRLASLKTKIPMWREEGLASLLRLREEAEKLFPPHNIQRLKIYSCLGEYARHAEKEAEAYFSQGLAGIPSLAELLEAGPQAYCFFTIGELYHNLGLVFCQSALKKDNQDQCIALLERVREHVEIFLVLFEQSPEKNLPIPAAKAHTSLGNVFLHLGLFDKAREQYQIAVDNHRKVGNRKSLPLANLCYHLAVCEGHVGNFEAAIRGMEKGAIPMLQKLGKPASTPLSLAKRGLAEYKTLYSLVLEGREKMEAGTAMYKEGRFEEAHRAYTEALCDFKEAYGSTPHLDLATAYHNKGSVYLKLGNVNEAATEYRIAYEIKKERLGPDHPSTTKTKEKLAACLSSLR